MPETIARRDWNEEIRIHPFFPFPFPSEAGARGSSRHAPGIQSDSGKSQDATLDLESGSKKEETSRSTYRRIVFRATGLLRSDLQPIERPGISIS